jgi:ABC-type branched-subunit amino acid transport system permease subunit
VNVSKYKVIAFVISALYAGCAGSLQAHMAPVSSIPTTTPSTR